MKKFALENKHASFKDINQNKRYGYVKNDLFSVYGCSSNSDHLRSSKKFKKSIQNFIKELKAYNFSDISNEKLQEFLDLHNLNQDDLFSCYSERYIK